MTIGANHREDYIGNGALDEYDYGFKIFSPTDLLVTTRTGAVETTLVHGTDYTVTGVGSKVGGTIILSAGFLAPGSALTIRRVRPVVQATDIRNQGGFYPSVHEDAFDHFIMVDQQQQNEIDNSLRLAETVEPGTVDTQLPFPEGGKNLAWNAAGTALVNTVTDASAAAASAASAAAALAAAQAAQDAAEEALAATGVGSDFWQTVLDETTSNASLQVLTSTRSESNAVAVPVLTKLQEVISVKDFGAVGNGASDDTLAIQRAINAAAGRPLFAPAGTYVITSPLTHITTAAEVFTQGLQLYGEGRLKTIFDNRVAGTALTNAFSTVNLSVIVTVAHPAHGKSVGNIVAFEGTSSTVGGLNMDGSWVIQSVIDGNSYTFHHHTPATATAGPTASATVPRTMLDIDTNTTLKFQAGIRLKGFQIKTTTSPIGSMGIRLRRAYHVNFDDVYILGMSSDGVRIVVTEGDGDGSNNVSFKDSRIEGCAQWGLHCDMKSGTNELSFLTLQNTFIQSCGTTSAATVPPSGGMKWRGQVCHMSDTAFVTNENVGLYVVGGAGLGNTMIADGVAWENNNKKHILIEGLDNGAFRNIQLYSNDAFVATNGILMDGTSSTIRNILIDGVVVRATSGNNPYTAFATTGPSAEGKNIEVKNVSFANFDHPGQVRFSGELIRNELLLWTPTLTFPTPGDLAVVYDSLQGHYTKNRDGLIRATFDIVTTTFTHTTASGALRITGLPFVSETVTGSFEVFDVQWSGITKANYTDITAKIDSNSSIIQFQASGSGQILADVAAADVPSGGTVVLRGTVFYRAAN